MLEGVNYDGGFMLLAILEARDALRCGERPFGCIIVDPMGRVIGRGSGTGTDLDPTFHSEMHAIRVACSIRRGLLEGCALYSTHEPCTMCCGAILHAKLSRVVFGSWRADLPTLFRARGIERISTALLKDTTHPPEVVADCFNKDCIHLFDDELREQRENDMWVGP